MVPLGGSPQLADEGAEVAEFRREAAGAPRPFRDCMGYHGISRDVNATEPILRRAGMGNR